MLRFVRSAIAAADRLPRRFWFFQQRDSVDCGPACLVMVGHHYGRRLPLSKVRELCAMDRQGTSLLQLSRAAEHIGFRTMRVRTTYSALVRDAPLPAIAHWDQKHFVVVYGRTRDGVRVADPARGLITYSEAEFAQHWATLPQPQGAMGFILLLEPTGPQVVEGDQDIKPSARGLSLLRRYLTRYRRTLVQVVLGSIAVAALRLALPFLTQAIVDVGIQQRDLGIIQLILIAQITLIVSRTGVEFLQTWLLLHMGARVDMTLVSDFLRKLLLLPLGFFEERRNGDLLQRVEDHSRVEQLLTTTTLVVVSSLLSLVVFTGALLFYSSAAFMVLVAGGALQVLYVSVFLRTRTVLDNQRFEQTAKQRGLLIECVAGIADIKLNSAEIDKRWNWERGQVALYRTNTRALRLEQLQQGGAVLVSEVVNAIITVVAAKQVIAGSLSLGGLLAVQYLVGQVAAPLSQLVGLVQSVQGAKLSLERMSEVFDAVQESTITPHQSPHLHEDKDLGVEGVVFGYQGSDGPQVLRGVNLTVANGKVTAIVGTSGSGKTTLLKLLLKFYDPVQGLIRLGEKDLRSIAHANWRRRCGAVMQDGYLFSDSIARNIALGTDEIDIGRVEVVARQACISDIVEALPLAYDTKIGPNGTGLSHGQRQRILIARALYHDPEFLFLDEATSSLDAETERQIVGNLDEVFRSRTVLVIAHRLSTVKRADQIIVMEHGTIAEHGTHDELVGEAGRYLELVRNQLELHGESPSSVRS